AAAACPAAAAPAVPASAMLETEMEDGVAPTFAGAVAPVAGPICPAAMTWAAGGPLFTAGWAGAAESIDGADGAPAGTGVGGKVSGAGTGAGTFIGLEGPTGGVPDPPVGGVGATGAAGTGGVVVV